MRLNRISESNVMTICITRELLLFDFDRPDISLASTIHPSQKLKPFEVAESFRVHFWLSQYIMRLNWTSESNVMTILITLELPLFNFKCLHISWASIIHLSQNLSPFEFTESFRVQFWLSRYIVRQNRIFGWKVLTIWITRELLLFDFERLDITWASIIHPSQKLWPFELAKSVIVLFWGSQYITRLNLTSEWKVMTTLIVRELPLFNFERLNISWASIIYPSQKLTSFEFVESFYVHFWLSQYITCLNLTSEWKVMTIWITRELPLLNFERLDITCASIIHPSQKLTPLEFAERFRVHFWLSQYIMHLNGTSEWKVMTILNTQELLLFNFECLDISWASNTHQSQTLKPFEFAESFRVQFWLSQHIMHLNWTTEWKVMTIGIIRELLLFNFECLDISWASIIHTSQKLWPFEFAESFRVQFRVSRYIMWLNPISESNVMTICITRELPLFDFDRLDILWGWIGYPSQKLWPFVLLESFRCLISTVPIYHGPQSYNRVKSYGHLNLPRSSLFNSEGLKILRAWIWHPSEKLWQF